MKNNITFFITSRSVLLRMRNVLDTSFREKSKHILCSVTFFPENLAVYKKTQKKKKIAERGRPQVQYDAWALHAGYLRPQTHTHTQNMCYLLLFHRNSCYTNAPQYYVTRTLTVLLSSESGGCRGG
jgi:hypothetical protein